MRSKKIIRSKKIPNYLLRSIVAIPFFPPFGIMAFAKATRVNAMQNKGDREGAFILSESVKKWCKLSFIIGPPIYIIIMLIIVIATSSPY